MKKIMALCLSLLMLASLLPGAYAEKETVNVFNWEDYINKDVIALFEKETGIKVNYMNFTTNEDMMVQIRTSTGAFDVVFPSDYCIERLIKEDLLEPIDYDSVPNAANTMDRLKNPSYDPGGVYSVPYMWGTVGILYDTTRVKGPIDSWGALFSEDYKGEVFMLDSIRDTVGLALKYLGYSMNTRDLPALQAATALLIKQKADGVVKAYQVDETKDKMVAGEGTLAVVWSGDAQYAINLNDKLAYVVPKEGSNVWVDAMIVPKTAKNKENAMKFINFLCRPDIAQMNCEYIEYSSPNVKAVELMGDAYQNNPGLNPSKETIDNCEFFNDINDFLPIYNTLWAQVKNTKIGR